MTHEGYVDEPLRGIYRAEDFESRVYGELGEEEVAELKRVGREIFGQLAVIAADHSGPCRTPILP
jgi:hypothetical protein